MENEKFAQIPEISSIKFSEFFWHFFSKSRDSLSFPQHSVNFRQNFMKIKILQKIIENRKFIEKRE